MIPHLHAYLHRHKESVLPSNEARQEINMPEMFWFFFVFFLFCICNKSDFAKDIYGWQKEDNTETESDSTDRSREVPRYSAARRYITSSQPHPEER